MKIIGRILILLVLAGAVTFAVLRSGWLKKEDPNLIRLSGNLELTEVDISFKMPGRVVELRVDEGSKVTKGMVVAILDRESTTRQRAREQAGVESAQSQLAQVITGVEYQREAVEGELALRRAEVQTAQAQLNDLLAGARPQEIEQAEAAARDARSWAEQAARDWDRAQTLYKNEDISTAQFDQYRAKYQSTQQSLKQSEERLSLIKAGARKEQIETARAQVARAQAAVRLSEVSRLEVKRREQELAVRKAEIQRAKAQVAVIDSQLDDTTVVSPVGGVVLSKSVEPGEVIAAGTTLVSIGDVEHPWMRGYINERDLGRVKLGTKVKLTTDSYPGKAYWGVITYIASEAEFTPKQIQTPEERVKLVYRIKIEVENAAQELKSNMPMDAEIALGQ